MDRGDLVSDELIINLIMSNMSRPSCINGGFYWFSKGVRWEMGVVCGLKRFLGFWDYQNQCLRSLALCVSVDNHLDGDLGGFIMDLINGESYRTFFFK